MKTYLLVLVLAASQMAFAGESHTITCTLQYEANGLVHEVARNGRCSDAEICFGFETEKIPLITRKIGIHTYFDFKSRTSAIELDTDDGSGAIGAYGGESMDKEFTLYSRGETFDPQVTALRVKCQFN